MVEAVRAAVVMAAIERGLLRMRWAEPRYRARV
jgi:hypothetical protein